MFVPAVPAVPARMWLDLDMMVGGGDSPASAGAAPPPLDTSQRGGKGGRRPKRVQAGKVEPGDSKAPPVGPLWKTRICSFFAAGGCRNAAQCPFAHGEEDLMPSPDFERTSVCPFLLSRGRCDKPGCRYAHHAEELRVQEGLLKTKMCAFYQHDQCIVGEACRFAHSEREIQDALAMQRAAAQRTRQPPPTADELAAQEQSERQLRRSAFVRPPAAEAAPALAPSSHEAPSPEEALRCVCGQPLSLDQRFCSACGTRAPARLQAAPQVVPQVTTQPADAAPGDADSSTACNSSDSSGACNSSSAGATLAAAPAKESLALTDADWPSLGTVRQKAKPGAAPRASTAAEAARQDGPPPPAATTPLNARRAPAAQRQRIVKSLRGAAQLRKEALVPEPAATLPSEVVDDTVVVPDIEDSSLVTELTKVGLGLAKTRWRSPQRHGDDAKPGQDLSPRGLPLQRQQRLPIKDDDDIDELGHDSVGGGSMWAVASRSSWPGTGCRNAGSYATELPGVKLVSHNTFLTIQDEEVQEDKGAARRSLSL